MIRNEERRTCERDGCFRKQNIDFIKGFNKSFFSESRVVDVSAG